MGFKESWVALIMQCVTTVSYSLLVNGEPQGFIRPSNGVKARGSLISFFILIL